MRKNEFRGKHVTNQEWVYGYFNIDNGLSRILEKVSYKNNDFCCNRLIDLKTVGQYTGIKDIKGKKIFEGDIIKTDIFRGIRGKAVIVFDLGSFLCEVISIPLFLPKCGMRVRRFYMDDKDMKIIGNKTDNPELLEEIQHE